MDGEKRRGAPEEVVLTYRWEEPVEPVTLRYERPLPERMLPPSLPPSRTGTKTGRMRNRNTALLALALLLAGLTCLGLGLWFIQQHGIVQGENGFSPEDDAPYGDYHGYYWQDGFEKEKKTAIRTYRPYGSSVVTLELMPEEGDAMEPGDVYTTLLPSVTTVLGKHDEDNYSVGTGIIFDKKGYIVTNYHVIAGCSDCIVRITDEQGGERGTYDALLVGGDGDKDLAVLKIDAPELVAASFGISDRLAVGDKVYAIGNPLGLELRNTFTDGIISAINRNVDVDGVTMTLLQTNVALNSGNSGGPLINRYGQVVGINTIKMMSGYDTIEGLGFAIPTSLAVRWVNEIIMYGKVLEPVLGITVQEPETLPDGTIGLRIRDVTPDGSGDRAGLQAGDYIVAFNGQTITRMEDILAIRHTLFVGDQVPVRICRDREYLDLIMEMQAESG